ncbi:hypothetical protein DM02DRAFT_613292 [Periconia macrospinosa]|uniref:Uncharacterized protein n=1 Tax=Periconia macrospinosa TaxID=97972 RepID=A0A2V1DUG4_9PLEO|nr:hypothetical protein DM02DRAFT_613292 [Periconia macrospinosa]
MSILPIFISGTILSTQGPTDVSILPTTASVPVLPTTSVSGEMSIPAGETPLLPTRPGPPSFNGSLSTSPTPTATVTTTSGGGSQSSGTSRSSGAPGSSAPGNSSASKIHGQSSVVAAVMVGLGFTWALL